MLLLKQKINLDDTFFLEVDNIKKDTFDILGFETNLEKEFLLFIGDSQVEFPKTFSLNEKYILNFISVHDDEGALGVFSYPTKKETLCILDKKFYSLKIDFDFKNKVIFDPNDDLVTEEFSGLPFFYKFYINDEIFDDFKIFDDFDVEVDDFKIIKQNKKNYIYFNPIQFKNYYFINNGNKNYFNYYKSFEFKKFYEKFNSSVINFEEPEFISYFYLKSNSLIEDFVLELTTDENEKIKIEISKNQGDDFLNSDFFYRLEKRITQIELFSKSKSSSFFVNDNNFFVYTQEQVYFYKNNCFYFQKKQQENTLFLAKEYKVANIEIPYSEFSIEKKYLFNGSNFVESELGNYFFQKNDSLIFSSNFFFETDFKVFKNKLTYSVQNFSFDLEYYNENFKDISNEIISKDGE